MEPKWTQDSSNMSNKKICPFSETHYGNALGNIGVSDFSFGTSFVSIQFDQDLKVVVLTPLERITPTKSSINQTPPFNQKNHEQSLNKTIPSTLTFSNETVTGKIRYQKIALQLQNLSLMSSSKYLSLQYLSCFCHKNSKINPPPKV